MSSNDRPCMGSHLHLATSSIGVNTVARAVQTGAAVVTLRGIRIGEEHLCPSWRGFAKGTLVRYAHCEGSPADTSVMTLDGQVIVEFLPWTHAVGRAQLEAKRRNGKVRVVSSRDGEVEDLCMYPSGAFEDYVATAC